MTAVGPLTLTLDARGNLTSDGVSSYGYDVENRLTSGPGGATLAYDPAGRLSQAVGTATARFLYDGQDVIAEFDAAGVLQERYVHGPGMDEPLVWYVGAGTTQRRWYAADERGSVIATTNAAGAANKVFASEAPSEQPPLIRLLRQRLAAGRAPDDRSRDQARAGWRRGGRCAEWAPLGAGQRG